MDAAALLADLVAIDSVNPALVPGAAGEEEIAGYVAAWMGERRLEVTVVDEPPGRPSVIGVARGSGGGASLMLNGHTDTVGVAGMQRPHEPQIRDGRLYGRGSFDMKGGLAACMLAGAAALGARLRGDVIVTAVADEEHASLGVQAVLRRLRADACIVTEPTSLRVCVAHKGFVWAELETRGRRRRPRRRARGRRRASLDGRFAHVGGGDPDGRLRSRRRGRPRRRGVRRHRERRALHRRADRDGAGPVRLT